MIKPYTATSLSAHHLAELTRLMVEEVKEAAVFFMDVDGIIESWNSAAEEMKGYNAEEAIGSHLSMLYTPEDRSCGWPQHNMQEAREHGFFREERWRMRKNGSLFWARVLLTALRNDAGEHVGFSKITLDLTEHKLLEHCVREKAETRRVLRAANAGKWTWHPDTGEVEICENFLALLGYANDATTVSFTQWLDFLDPAHRSAVQLAFDNARAGCPKKSLHLEILMRQKNRECRWFDARAEWYQPSPDAPYVLQGISIDIQELKIVSEERSQAIEQLQAEDVRKNEFLAMLAHELRNPLAPISAGAELLRTGRGNEDRIRQTSEIISRQVSHMTNLIDDLLDVSRVTRGLAELNMRDLDIRRVVTDAVEQARPLIQLKRHRLALHMPGDVALIAGDEKRLVQVIANLLNNAAKYTSQDGQITLDVKIHAAHVELEIVDNGIGMAPDLVGRVFDLFTQAKRSSDRSSGGLGLGLSLVKSLVELHGGKVAAASDGVGRGSTFTVMLPRILTQQAGNGAPAATTPVDPAPARLNILVVDDNVDAAEVLCMLLEQSGHDVTVENAAHQALERAALDLPDAALLDIGLPDMDGLELARRLRSVRGLADVTLIAITGYGQEVDKQNAYAAGFNHYLTKPVDYAALVALLGNVSKEGAGLRS